MKLILIALMLISQSMKGQFKESRTVKAGKDTLTAKATGEFHTDCTGKARLVLQSENGRKLFVVRTKDSVRYKTFLRRVIIKSK